YDVLAQSDTIMVRTNTVDREWIDFIDYIQKSTQTQFIYKKDWLAGKSIRDDFRGKKLGALLSAELTRLNLSHVFVHDLIIILNTKEIERKKELVVNEPDLVVVGDG